MKLSYDFLPPEEREWVERCQALAVVVLLVVLALLAGSAFAGDAYLGGADQAVVAAPAVSGAI